MQNGSDTITTDHLNDIDALVGQFEGLDIRLQGVFLERVRDSYDQQREARKAALLAELAALGVTTEVDSPKTGAKTTKRTVRPSSTLYRSKTDPEKSWTGRGKTPGWLTEEMDATGLGKETFLVSAA